MRSVDSLLAFAAAAAATTTTSLWVPERGYYSSSDNDFIENLKASVVGKSGSNITLAVAYEPETRTIGTTRTTVYTYSYAGPTLTWIGSSSFQSISTNNRYESDRTYALDCSLAETTKALCTRKTTGADMFSSYCSYYNRYYTSTGYATTRVITYSNPPTRVTQIETRTPGIRGVPSYCLSGSELPASLLTTTYTVRPVTYPVILTAGEEKLSATAGSSPSGTGATPTASPNGSSGSGASPSSSGTPPPQNSNAAGPMVTFAPALAGLGAAAAAVFL
ncbi:hypothetical protein CC80DRAFT_493506 [Byssothecium circinans]|uniref:Uncharacterized protein n=1 Tax=Byssothecium circinans TaxID=147558 RepID=A0A6A5TQM1_9PLEO|nr:hypothetical protein CC80DRAFT_493506 [Byssothecium circinans]